MPALGARVRVVLISLVMLAVPESAEDLGCTDFDTQQRVALWCGGPVAHDKWHPPASLHSRLPPASRRSQAIYLCHTRRVMAALICLTACRWLPAAAAHRGLGFGETAITMLSPLDGSWHGDGMPPLTGWRSLLSHQCFC